MATYNVGDTVSSNAAQKIQFIDAKIVEVNKIDNDPDHWAYDWMLDDNEKITVFTVRTRTGNILNVTESAFQK